MKYSISPDNAILTLTCSPEEQDELRTILADNGHFRRDDELEALEGLIANSELDWVDPADTGDLTDAPLLGICGQDGRKDQMPEEHYGLQSAGWNVGPVFRPILQRWGYPNYQLRSFLTDLMEHGETRFINHW